MTVGDIVNDSMTNKTLALCIWFDGAKKLMDSFPLTSLKLETVSDDSGVVTTEAGH